MDALVGPDVADVLDVFRGGVPARGAGAVGDRDVARRPRDAVEPLPVVANEIEQFAYPLVRPALSDVVDGFRGRVPTLVAGAARHGDVAPRPRDAAKPTWRGAVKGVYGACRCVQHPHIVVGI